MFIDEAKIYVKAGDGGHGCISFRREKFCAKGGPNGGDGGRGGEIYFEAVGNIDTLTDFVGRHHWRAKNGMPGMGNNMHGLNGEDMIIKVPLGTMIYDADFGLLLKDLKDVGTRVKICQSGRGGRGNRSYATSIRQTPRIAQDGKMGQERNLHLKLKLIADVGLVGLPNAGKSTLLSRCSAARPKIANYPFTTLEPVLGIVELADYRRFVIADIPGLIEGAHTGAGLGHDFLKHIERTRTIVHIIDVMPPDGSDPAENYLKIKAELSQYSDELAKKDDIVVANKIDLDPDGEAVKKLNEKLGKKTIAISAVTGKGLKELNEILWTRVCQIKAAQEDEE